MHSRTTAFPCGEAGSMLESIWGSSSTQIRCWGSWGTGTKLMPYLAVKSQGLCDNQIYDFMISWEHLSSDLVLTRSQGWNDCPDKGHCDLMSVPFLSLYLRNAWRVLHYINLSTWTHEQTDWDMHGNFSLTGRWSHTSLLLQCSNSSFGL